ncbi:MAG: helicase-associated domain-containing protein [Gammaproteobacteria bacterium]|nr:helicase-associated domain-containing protein [Gammaproteobacteria bacterium]
MSIEIITTKTVDVLKKCIPLLDTEERPTRKEDYIKLILKHMLSPRIETYWQRLEPLEQKAIAEAIYNWDGRFYALRFERKYLAIPKIFIQQPYSYQRTSNAKQETSTLRLFFYGGVIPDEFIAKLKEFVLRPTEDAIKVSSSTDILDNGFLMDKADTKVRVIATQTAVDQELAAILRLIDNGKISVSDKTAQATTASVKSIDTMLVGGDFYSAEDDLELVKYVGGSIRPIRSFAWPLLLQTGGLAKRVGKKLELTGKGKKAITGTLGDTIKTLYTRWRDKGSLDEFRRVDLIKGQNGKGRRMTKVAERRHAVEEVLGCCPVDEWVSVDELFRYMQAGDFGLEVVHDPWKLYLCDSNYGSLGYDGHHDFTILQGRYLLTYLFEYLATLGMIDVAYIPPYHVRSDFNGIWGADDIYFLSRYDGLLYFKLNSLGAWCLDLVDNYQPIVPTIVPLLHVNEQFQIDLIRDATPTELLTLNQYTEFNSDAQRCLTPESLLSALEQGFSPESLLVFLESYSDEPLNDEVKQLFSDFGSRSAAMNDGGMARLIKCGNAGLARMISTDPTTRTHCQLINGNTLVVPTKSEAALRKGLRKLGYVLPQEK